MSTGPALSQAIDWLWYVHQDAIRYDDQVYEARGFIFEHVLRQFQDTGIPYHWVYNDYDNTINLVFPRLVLVQDVTLEGVLKDAKFMRKEIPEHDWRSSKDLKEAILGGSQMQKEWH